MTLTENYTFQLGDSGVILNSSASVPFVDITRVVGLDNAPFRETVRDHEGTDGGFLDAEFEKAREILLEGVVYCSATTIESYLDSLKYNFAPLSSPIPLYISDENINVRTIFVKPRGAHYEWTTDRRTGQVPIQFGMYAEDPRLYGPENSVDMPFGSQVFTGFGFNLSFDFGFGGTTTTTDGQFFTNLGNRPTPVIFIINGPVTNPRIVNDTLSKTLIFNITLAGGETLKIDTANRTVLLNGTANRRYTLSYPDWFFFMPGGNFIRYRAESGTGSTMTVKWRSAWR